MSWYKAAQVSVENGSKLVTVVSAEPLTGIRAHDSLEIAQFNGVDIDTTYIDPATDDLIIKLVSEWPHANQELQSAQVVPTAVNFNGGAQILEDTKNKVFAQLSSFFAFGLQESGTVTFSGIGENSTDFVTRSIPQYRADLDSLESQVDGSVSTVAAIDAQVNGVGGLLEQVADAGIALDTIESTLLGHVSTTLGYMNDAEGHSNDASDAKLLAGVYRDSALAHSGTTLTYRNETEGYRDTVIAYNTAAENARDLAEQYRDEAEAFKDEAGNIVGGDFVTRDTTINGKALDSSITISKSDIGLANVDNTSDALKPISNATQSALDDKVDTTTVDASLALKADKTSINNIDNTSDADKPVSTATQEALDSLELSLDLPTLQTQLDKIRKLALAGL